MSQVSIIDIEGNNPQIPTTFVADVGFAIPIANTLNILGDTVVAGVTPVFTVGSGNTITTNVQISQAIAASNATNVGLSAFNSAQFTVDANGFVSLSGGGGLFVDSFQVQAITAPGVNPVTPTVAGLITFNGTAVANHSVPIETRSRALNAMNVEVQYATTAAATDATKSGVAHFDSAAFTVDAGGFVQLVGGGPVIDSIAVDAFTAPGTNPVLPTAAGVLTVTGAQVASGVVGANVIRTNSIAANAYRIEIQRSTAVAAPDSTKNGVSHFNSAQFTVDASGFVSTLATVGGILTLTGNAGGAIPPDGLGNIDIVTDNTTALFTGAANALTLDFGLNNLFIGNSAPSLTSGTENVALGQNALVNVIDGGGNTCLGFNAGEDITSGNNNVFIGLNSGDAVTTSSQSVAIGVGALENFTSGAGDAGRNTVIGYAAAPLLLTGTNNIFVGAASGQAYTSNEFSNICIGNDGVVGDSNAMRLGTSGSSAGRVNTCYIGGVAGVTVPVSAPIAVDINDQVSSLGLGTAGQVLTSNGSGASPTWQAGGGSTLTGNSGGALSPTAGNWNILTSNSTLSLAGTGSTLTLNFNLTNLVLGSSIPSLTSGSRNVGVGSNCLNALTSGLDNTVVGYQAGQALTSAAEVTLVGASAGSALTISPNVTAIGSDALAVATGASDCTAVGYQALRSFTTATSARNTVLGSLAAGNLLTGVRNIVIGYSAASSFTGSESSNIIIGSVAIAGENNTTRIGSNGTGTGQQNTCFIGGITGATVTGTAVLCATTGQLGTISSSLRYKENVTDMSEDVSVMNLRPVEFNYKSDASQKKKYGLIAEEVEQDFPYLCFYNENNEPESVQYHELPVLLLKEIQRLNQRITALEASI